MRANNHCRQIKAITNEPENYNRTGIFLFARNCFTPPTVQVSKWKMLAARTALQSASAKMSRHLELETRRLNLFNSAWIPAKP
jgi:hypothetical protein